MKPLALCDDDANANGASGSQSRKGCGGSAFQHFYNLRMATSKATHAPDRALVAEERREIEGKIHEEWARVKDSPLEYDLWRQANNNKSKKPSAPGAARDRSQHAPSASPIGQPFRNLWSRECSVDHIASPTALLEFQARRKREQPSDKDEHVVRSPVPDRKSSVLPFRGSLHGCRCSVKNVCRLHRISQADANDLNTLCRRFNGWVESLPKEVRFECSSLLWCEGQPSTRRGGDACLLGFVGASCRLAESSILREMWCVGGWRW